MMFKRGDKVKKVELFDAIVEWVKLGEDIILIKQIEGLALLGRNEAWKNLIR